jgi:2-keto-4-pentenoate hydratase/2-oxohepta-3-ene-1,7-dioic acid hydratase in catechol pathway
VKLVRFQYLQGDAWGVVAGTMVRLLPDSPYGDCSPGDVSLPLEGLSLLPPCNPGKIVCVGLNYRGHAVEMGVPLPEEPILFLKPPSALIGHRQQIIHPACSKRVDYEAELAVVIRSQLKDAGASEAGAAVLGYTCANDVTARDLQGRDVQWTRAKSFDTFCPVGPWLITDLDPDNLSIKLILNGETRQDSSTREMIFPVPQLISFISTVMTLYPGDLILTGTPAGIGAMQVDDVVSVEIGSIGILTNQVAESRTKIIIDNEVL